MTDCWVSMGDENETVRMTARGGLGLAASRRDSLTFTVHVDSLGAVTIPDFAPAPSEAPAPRFADKPQPVSQDA